MKFLDHILHFLTPRSSNNHRARGLHLSLLLVYGLLILGTQLGLSAFAHFSPGVLGYASNVTVADLLDETNAKRAENNLPALTLNQQLSDAAVAKGSNMFKEQYWAHTSPSGKDPWSFISAAHYRYLFAGENLARDFGDSHSVVEAWMQSPSHKENLLNSRYKEVGFGVVNGKYGNYETTIVVQMFGAQSGTVPTVDAPQTSEAAPGVQTQEVLPSSGAILSVVPPPPPKNNVKVDIATVTKVVSLGFVILLITLLAIDAVVIYHKKVVRLSGHNTAHILLFIGLLLVLQLVGRGLVL